MKVLSIKEPWVTGIFQYNKNIENRTWNTFYRGKLLIHVSSTKPTKSDEKAFFDICESLGIKNPAFNLSNCGLILGVVDLVDVIKDSKSKWAAAGQYHWKIENPMLLKEPITAKGKLNLWELPATTEIKLLTQNYLTV